MNTFIQCYFGTIAVYMCVLFLEPFISIHILVALTVISVIYIMFVGCVNHINMQLDRNELVELKKSARIVLSLLMLMMVFEIWLDVSRELIYCSAMGIIVCAVLLFIEKATGGDKCG